MIGSDETNIEAEIVYKAPGGQREPTIEIVEIEENVRGGGGEEDRRGWGGREGRRRGRKRRPGRQREREGEEEQSKEDEDEEEEYRREKDFRFDKNLFRSPASNQQPFSILPILLLPLVFHSQGRLSFYYY